MIFAPAAARQWEEEEEGLKRVGWRRVCGDDGRRRVTPGWGLRPAAASVMAAGVGAASPSKFMAAGALVFAVDGRFLGINKRDLGR